MTIVASPHSLPNKKYQREIERRLPPGYRIAYGLDPADGARANRVIGKHPFLFDPQGEVVRRPNGMPVRVSSTPGSPYSIVRDIREIKKAGVSVK